MGFISCFIVFYWLCMGLFCRRRKDPGTCALARIQGRPASVIRAVSTDRVETSWPFVMKLGMHACSNNLDGKISGKFNTIWNAIPPNLMITLGMIDGEKKVNYIYQNKTTNGNYRFNNKNMKSNCDNSYSITNSIKHTNISTMTMRSIIKQKRLIIFMNNLTNFDWCLDL